MAVSQQAQTPEQLQARINALEAELRQCKEREAQLAETERNARMFRAMTESTHAMVMIASVKENRAVYANPAAARLTGYSIEELTASPPPNLFSEKSMAAGMRQREAFMRGEDVPPLSTFELITKAGEKRIVENTWAVMDLGDGDLHKVTVTFDVTEKKEAVERLAESEKKFRALADSTTAQIAITQREGAEARFVYANRAVLEHHGVSWEQLALMDPADTLSQAALEAGGKAAERAAAEGNRSFSFEYEHATGIWQLVHAVQMKLDGKDSTIWTSFDISDQKRAQHALAESEKKFRTIFETTGTGTMLFGDDTIIMLTNDEWAKMVGYSREEIEGKMSWADFFTEESLKKMWAYHKQRGIDPSSVPRKYESDVLTRDKTVRHALVTIDMVPGSQQRVASIQDLTQIKEAQKELADSAQRYRTIFETTGTGTIIFGDDKIIQLANEEWAAMVGYAREDIEGKLSWSHFFTEGSLEKMMAYHAKRSVNPTSAPRVYEADLRDRAGRVHNGYITIAMVPGTDQRVGSFSDLTELKRAQKQMYQADKMAALGQIIAGVAHEINNPNNFIYFNLPILRKYLDGMRRILDDQLADDPGATILGMPYAVFLEDIYKLLENMEHGSSRITGIVSDLKNYVRADESSQMKEEAVAPIVNQVMTLVGKQVRKMVKRFDVDVAENLPNLTLNAGKIEQVLINLLVNAAQAANKPQSWVKLTVRAAPDNDHVAFVVEDNGAGIPISIQDQVFEPFFTSKGRDAGTGLGLSISHKIIEDHGGTIDMHSVEGEGTTFTVRLPLH